MIVNTKGGYAFEADVLSEDRMVMRDNPLYDAVFGFSSNLAANIADRADRVLCGLWHRCCSSEKGGLSKVAVYSHLAVRHPGEGAAKNNRLTKLGVFLQSRQ